MKMFFNTLTFGATLTASIISVFQNVSLLVFIKRASITFVIFYFMGAALNIMWNAAAVYMPAQSEEPPKGQGREQTVKK